MQQAKYLHTPEQLIGQQIDGIYTSLLLIFTRSQRENRPTNEIADTSGSRKIKLGFWMKHLNITPALYDYLLDVSLREHPVLEALREETAKLPLAIMQVAPEQAQFMQFLIQLI